MKVTKIDVKRTVMELPASHSPIYSEVERLGWPDAKILREGEVPAMLSMNETRHDYEIRKVQLRDGRLEYYAVELDQRGTWEIYDAVSNSKYEEWLEKAREIAEKTGWRRGLKEGAERQKEKIRELSWWKRLTNNF